jgi:hypothetical protein
MRVYYVDFPGDLTIRGDDHYLVWADNRTQAAHAVRDYIHSKTSYNVPRTIRAFALESVGKELGESPRVIDLSLVPYWSGKENA